MKKKLIEVALPLEAISKASANEKQPFTRKHPRSDPKLKRKAETASRRPGAHSKWARIALKPTGPPR